VARLAPIPIEECPDGEPLAKLEHLTMALGPGPNGLQTMPRVPASGSS